MKTLKFGAITAVVAYLLMSFCYSSFNPALFGGLEKAIVSGIWAAITLAVASLNEADQ